MRWQRPLRKLRWYLQAYRWQGIWHFARDMAFWRLRNLRHLYRIARWRRMVRRIPPDELCFNIQGLYLYLNPDDLGLSAELAVEHVHEPILTEALQSVLHPGMTVVDVGANLGYFALLAARAVGPEGKVIALEPFPVSYALLERNIKANNLTNVITFQLAAGERDGDRVFYCYDQANWNSLRAGRRRPISEILVKVCRLDRLLEFEPRIDLIRMDVEGSELEVVRGAIGILNKHHPMLVIEVHPQCLEESEFEELMRCIHVSGYMIKACWERWREEIVWGNRGIKNKRAWDLTNIGDYRVLKMLEWEVTIFAAKENGR